MRNQQTICKSRCDYYKNNATHACHLSSSLVARICRSPSIISCALVRPNLTFRHIAMSPTKIRILQSSLRFLFVCTLAATSSLIWVNTREVFFIAAAQDKAPSSSSHTNYTETIPGSDVTIAMVAIPGGTFMMGGKDAGRTPRRTPSQSSRSG
jgi:formylglycine-generating enzyme required for sulfatase activity